MKWNVMKEYTKWRKQISFYFQMALSLIKVLGSVYVSVLKTKKKLDENNYASSILLFLCYVYHRQSTRMKKHEEQSM